MSQSVITPAALVRISIEGEGKRLDTGIPSQIPLIELMPSFARNLGVLDPGFTHGGYALHRADGSALDPSDTAGNQGVRDGELLTLVRGGLLVEPLIYDDVVEAVIDANTHQNHPWTPRDSARTALAVSLLCLGLCAVLLTNIDTKLVIGPIIAASGTVVLIVVAAVLTRFEQTGAGHVLGLTAAFFGALTGYLAAPATTQIWGWPFAVAGLGAIIGGGMALAFTQGWRQLHLISIVFGALLGLSAMITALLPAGHLEPYVIMVAVTASVSNALPWIALSSTRIQVISPQSDLDIIATPAAIDPEDITRRTEAGHRILTALRVGFGLTITVATFTVATSVTGTVLCALAFIGMMFQSRQISERSGVLVMMAMGATGLVITGLTAITALPEIRVPLLVILLVAVSLLIGLTLLVPRARVQLGRIADTFEIVMLALLLPLGAIASGLV